MPKINTCGFCGHNIPTINGMKKHCARKADCRAKYYAQVEQSAFTVWDNEVECNAPQRSPSPIPMESDSESLMGDNPLEGDNFVPERLHERTVSPDVGAETSFRPSKRARVEDAEDDEAPNISRYTEEYPGNIASTLGEGKTKFEELREYQKMEGLNADDPFSDDEEWELVRWLMKNVGQNKTDEYLKLPIVSPCNYIDTTTYRNNVDSKANKAILSQ